jgi:Xaa-Pro aminopeptidase
MATIAERLSRLRERFDVAEIEAFFVSQPESRYYLSGYTGSDLPPRDSAGFLLITRDAAYLLTDPRTNEQAEKEAAEYEVKVYSAGARASDLIKELVERHGVKRLGFEAIHLPFSLYRSLSEALKDLAEFVPTNDLVDQLRIQKDEAELELLRRCQAVLDDCFEHLCGFIRPGVTERDVAWEVERYLRTHGADGTSFPSIVASGPNASMPHAVVSDRQIQAGEPITIDIGALLGGYCTDMTRTVCIGPAPERLKEVYEIVERAQREAEAGVQVGMTGQQTDAIARDIIKAAGYGEYFTHSLGHGIGLEVHEPPWVSPLKGETVLQPNMVFSVEPGIYIPGWGGVRIEDLVVLTPTGADVLPRAHKNLEITGARG